MFNEQPSAWYVAYTRPKCEKKVADLFTRKKVEHYHPVKQLVRARKIIQEPLFPSYVFVHIPESRSWVVRETDNVVNLVHWLGSPAVIPDHEIALIRRFLSDYEEVAVEPFPIKAGEERTQVGGGKIIEMSRNRVKVELSSLGCMLVAKVPSREITVITGSRAVNGDHY
ncbi:MAG: UpxY family transcription antiterminator [Chitinophaga sp.]|uniref:transcription termination/antitermination NusG family protein n=1 Tax=Chitinophaga sp. TaxID=1869181 RepID=UPI001B189F89|nr:transcription termination/antitermination NusG family protein [Chitinophaga sp.]MBO9732377.1 UpxY family transcription antiterminator [Chitinophaga sp.]